MNESEKKSVEDRVHKILSDIKLAQAVINLNDDLGDVHLSPMSALDIESFDLFPYEYQYFISEVGLLNISRLGYSVFYMSIPKLCNLDDPDWDAAIDPIFDDDLDLIWCGEDADLENLMFLASAPNNYESLAVDNRNNSFIETSGMESVGFLDFVERHIYDLYWFILSDRTRNNDNKDLVVRCLTANGRLLGKVSARLRDDPEVVVAAIKSDSLAYEYASDRLKRRKSIAILALEESFQYERLDPALREDREIAFIAVSLDGSNLKFVGSELRADKEIVAAAISNNPEARQYTLPDL